MSNTHEESHENIRIIKYLTERLKRFNYHYFVKGEQLVDNFTYDSELRELKFLEEMYPHMKLDSSPNNPKNYYNNKEGYIVKRYAQPHAEYVDIKVGDIRGLLVEPYVVDYDVQGVNVRLKYVYGNLHSASIEETAQIVDINNKLIYIVDIPKYIPQLKREEDFTAIVKVYGEMKECSSDILCTPNTERVMATAHTIINSDKTKVKDLSRLSQIGFTVNNKHKVINNENELAEYVKLIDTTEINYKINGITLRKNKVEESPKVYIIGIKNKN